MTTDISASTVETLACAFDADALKMQGKSDALKAFYRQTGETLRAQAARIAELEAALSRSVQDEARKERLIELREAAHADGRRKGEMLGFLSAGVLLRQLAQNRRGSYDMAATVLTWKVRSGQLDSQADSLPRSLGS